MKDKARQTIGKYRMLQPGDRVAAGVSGGADSMALLAFLMEIAPEYSLELVVCHVNHQLRGEESRRDQAFVEAFCARRGVECRVLTIDAAALAARRGCSVEVAARNARYGFFEQVAGENGKIATAHTASDSMETTLFHLVRGTGLRGLCGIPPMRGNVVRPLIACTRQQVEQYCADRGLEYVTDSSNLTDAYTRNVIRRHIVPRLYQINPAVHHAFAGLYERLGQDSDYLEAAAQQAGKELAMPDGSLNRAGYLALHPAIGRRVLLGLFVQQGVAPSARLTLLADQVAQTGSGRQELAKGIFFYSSAEKIGICRQTPVRPADRFEVEAKLPAPGQSCILQVAGRRIKLENRPAAALRSQKINNCYLKNSLDYDKIKNTLVFRPKKEGDRFAPVGRGVTKTLKKLFQEQGIPPTQRGKRLVLASPQQIVWVEGLGVSSHTAAGPQTKQIITIQILAQPEEQQ